MIPEPVRRKGRPALTATIAIVAAVAAVVAFAGSGLYNVAASKRDNPVVSWLLRKTMERSVRHHARLVDVPNVVGQGEGEIGFRRYDEMCVQCHGAPGVVAGAIADGLNPKPVRLERVNRWNVAETYWIIRYGVRMTGMAAFEGSHDDTDLWELAAFVKRLPEVSAAEYATMRRVRDSMPSR